MDGLDTLVWVKGQAKNEDSEYPVFLQATNRLLSSQITNSACLCHIPDKIDKALNITSWTKPSHKTRGVLSDLLRLGEGAGSQAPWSCANLNRFSLLGPKGFPVSYGNFLSKFQSFLEMIQSRKVRSAENMPRCWLCTRSPVQCSTNSHKPETFVRKSNPLVRKKTQSIVKFGNGVKKNYKYI